MLFNQGYLVRDQFNELFKAFKKLSVMIASLIDYLKGSRMKGEKFKKRPYKSLADELAELTKQKP
ncbi:MAG: hypothetical protein HYY81_06995 [Deltaproteobacteria bacterium]|nr:hypothetical protein [Deltaproteobacteria bacterium]